MRSVATCNLRRGVSSWAVVQHCASRLELSYEADVIMLQRTNSTILVGMFREPVSICRCFGQIRILHMRRKCYFRASGQNSDIVIKFSDHDFLYGTNILAINEHLPCHLRLLPFSREHNTCCALHWNDFHQVWMRRRTCQYLTNVFTTDTLCHAAVLTVWPCTFEVYQLSRNQTLYQI